jgi:hypothetical protein
VIPQNFAAEMVHSENGHNAPVVGLMSLEGIEPLSTRRRQTS